VGRTAGLTWARRVELNTGSRVRVQAGEPSPRVTNIGVLVNSGRAIHGFPIPGYPFTDLKRRFRGDFGSVLR
jgi:hypothetical protein